MCLSTPGQVTQAQDAMAEVEIAGRTSRYNALSRPDVKIGDYVLTYANMIVDIISEEGALRIQQSLQVMADALEQETADESASEPSGGTTTDDEPAQS